MRNKTAKALRRAAIPQALEKGIEPLKYYRAAKKYAMHRRRYDCQKPKLKGSKRRQRINNSQPSFSLIHGTTVLP